MFRNLNFLKKNNFIKIFFYEKFNNYIIALSFIIFAFSLFFFYFFFDLGFDLTDESAYFATSLKSEYSTNIFNFDLFFKKHFELTGYNLKIFRFSNLILIILSNIILYVESIKYLKNKKCNVNVYIVLAIFLLSSISIYYWIWLPTPSYNTYSLIFCTLLSANLINHNCKNIFLIFFKIFLSSLLTVLILFSKPTSGLSIIFLYFLLIMLIFKNKLFHIFYFVFLFLFIFIITNFYYEKSVIEFILKFKESVDVISLKEMHGISSTIVGYIIEFSKNIINQFLFIILIVISFFLKGKNKYKVNLLISFYFFIILILGDKSSWITLIIVFNLYLFAMNKKFVCYKEALIPMAVSFAFVIGTANNFTVQILICLNLLLTSFTILTSHKRNFLILLFLILNIKLYTGIYHNIQKPYHLNGPLKSQNFSTNLYFDKNKFQIQTDYQTKEFIENFREVFLDKNVKFKEDFFIIDMTGTLPIVNLIIPSKILEPWIGGGTSGSNNMMHRLIGRLSSDDLKNSFFIFSNNRRSIPINILQDYSIELDLVASINPPSYLLNLVKIYKIKNK